VVRDWCHGEQGVSEVQTFLLRWMLTAHLTHHLLRGLRVCLFHPRLPLDQQFETTLYQHPLSACSGVRQQCWQEGEEVML
jgi:hypothetical protein